MDYEIINKYKNLLEGVEAETISNPFECLETIVSKRVLYEDL